MELIGKNNVDSTCRYMQRRDNDENGNEKEEKNRRKVKKSIAMII